MSSKRITSFLRGVANATRTLALLSCAALTLFGLNGCDDDYVDNVSVAKNQLQIKVSTNLTKAGTGIIRGNFLPSGAVLGVSLRASGGGVYDGTDYTNIAYTADGTESAQTWKVDQNNPIMLSNTDGVAYAYFPRIESVSDITAVPIENASETDYMYAQPAHNISIANKTAAFEMSHVMSIIRVKVVKGTYTGTGAISEVTVKGQTAGTSAKLNVTDGSFTDVSGAGSTISKAGSWTFENFGSQDLWTVPAKASSTLTLTTTVDGNLMAATTSEPLEILGGKIYTYTLNINSSDMVISPVSVVDWDIVAKDNLNPEVKLTWDSAPDGVYAG